MSTRGAWGIQTTNTIKAMYNHFDSYPEGLGVRVLRSLQVLNFDNLKQKLLNLTWLEGENTTDEELINRYRKFSDNDVSTKSLNELYVLFRHLQDPIALHFIASGEVQHLPDSADFLKDALFCEWAYIINFDDNTLDVYDSCKKIKSFDLNALPSEKDFLTDLEQHCC